MTSIIVFIIAIFIGLISALLLITAFAIALSIFKSSGFGLYLGNVQSRSQSNLITSQPIPSNTSGAKIPAVPFPHATTTLIFFLILFLLIRSFL